METVKHTKFRECLMSAYVRGWYDGIDGISNDDGKRPTAHSIADAHPIEDNARAMTETLKECLAITEDRQAGSYDDIMRLCRAALRAAGVPEVQP